MSVAPSADHAHHPNADSSVEFKGYAAFAPKTDVKPWAYNPPQLGTDFVEIEISHCGICYSDIHTIDSDWGDSTYPVIVGHEIVGKVTAVGTAVSNLKVGDRVGVGAQVGSCLNKKKNCYECGSGNENHCSKHIIWTYNTDYPDGQISQGGYAEKVRCDSHFAFKIPEEISSAHAAPLMCAGATVYSPLARSIKRPNMRVAVVGIGGLGHLGVLYAVKLQQLLGGKVDVTAISHNSKKKELALQLGATDYIDTSDKAALSKAYRSFDYVLSTANGTDMDYSSWLGLLRLDGVFCTVGLPKDPMPIKAFDLLAAQISITASGIGSIKEIEEMLAFSAKHNVRPMIEVLPMSQANEGIKRVRDNNVRFRVVLENPQK